MPPVSPSSQSDQSRGQDAPLNLRQRGYRILIMIIFAISMVVYAGPMMLQSLGLVTVADVGVILGQHINSTYKYDLVNKDGTNIGSSETSYRFEDLFLHETRYRVNKLGPFAR